MLTQSEYEFNRDVMAALQRELEGVGTLTLEYVTEDERGDRIGVIHIRGTVLVAALELPCRLRLTITVDELTLNGWLGRTPVKRRCPLADPQGLSVMLRVIGDAAAKAGPA